jgi:MYXO-CTERM domain-containing protein
MKPRSGTIVALFLLATCSEDTEERNSTNLESGKLALGVVPPTEVAVWRKVGSSSTPDARYLQAAAFDETRKVVVMFGGTNTNPNTGTVAPNQETWEWSLATGKWTNRTGTGSAPNARSGAAMVFDSLRGKFVLFGGRAGSGSNFEDTWEWDPATGGWTNVSAAGSYPSARSQHGMVYEKSTGKILLFGGGRSDPYSSDGSGVSVSLGDTWEYDPVAYKWTLQTVASAPSVRHDFGMVWDSSRNKAMLFAGLQTDIASAPGVPKQDTWEWDPATATWTERTAAGSKPSQRYGHAMAFDGSRNKAVVFGGWDISTGGTLNDLWDWEPTTGAWTRRLTGSESGVPSARMYASMISDDVGLRLEIVAGAAVYNAYGSGGTYGSGGSVGFPPGVPVGVGYGTTGSREVWELNPATPTFTDRTAPLDVPSARYSQAMAYNPATGKTYLFGGSDASTGQVLNDLWAWDGKTWAQVAADVRPHARSDAAMAYDPARKSLLLFGGYDPYSGTAYGDTWEFTSAGKWVQLGPASSPDPLMGHGMVTDTTRNKILLFGGMNSYMWLDVGPSYKDPMRNEVWEWDGLTTTWTNRTPTSLASSPTARQYPLLAYDEGRQKMFLYDGENYSSNPTLFWEWDPLSAGWTNRSTGDALGYAICLALGYDSIRRRAVLLMDPNSQTWEVDTKGPTWYVRTLPTSPGILSGSSMVFDSLRGVVVLFGSQNTNLYASETWEYSVTNLGNGEGCTAAFVTSCASGNCVDGVCCDVAACTGACKSCNVAGSEGACVLAKAGTEVTGSCAVGQACDGTGSCKTKNGQACTVAGACASGFCADGVCCDGACAGTCASCNQAGRAGRCTPYPAGTDPQSECGSGTGVCKSTCDGAGTCAYPGFTVTCGSCLTCDGMGTCSNYDYNCGSYGGSGGSYGGSGGRPYPSGGAGGGVLGGAGGGVPVLGGAGGRIPNLGGAAGGIPNVGGAAGGVPSYGGSIGAPDAGTGDASSTTKLNHSGCSCELGKGQPARPVLAAPFLIAGAALLLRRRRRRQ